MQTTTIKARNYDPKPVGGQAGDADADGYTVEGLDMVLPPMPKGMVIPEITDAYPLVLQLEEVEPPVLPPATDDLIDAASRTLPKKKPMMGPGSGGESDFEANPVQPPQPGPPPMPGMPSGGTPLPIPPMGGM